MYKWAVYETDEVEMQQFETYEEALEEYERLKRAIMVAGEGIDDSIEVYIFKTVQVAKVVEDTEQTDDPEPAGFDFWAKWQDEKVEDN